VDIEMYELGNPELTAATIAASRRGVAVTVIDDPSVAATAATAAVLRAAGIDVVDYPVRKLMIDHVKLLVVDADVAVVGGINWGANSAANHDFDAEVEGPAARNLARVFARDLVTAGRQVAVPDDVPDPAVVVATTLPEPRIRDLAVALIDEARTTLDLELFVLTDSGIVHALERAHARGVAVRVLLDPRQRPSDRSAAELEGAGVAVRLYRGRGELLHAKAGVADGARTLFGSANWSGGGFERNHELDVEVLDCPAVARTFTQAMDADWAASGG
jgi:phosphatidylserine/phosphatidylglycerophosphate/cardiolipin synthase-like enzyme